MSGTSSYTVLAQKYTHLNCTPLWYRTRGWAFIRTRLFPPIYDHPFSIQDPPQSLVLFTNSQYSTSKKNDKVLLTIRHVSLYLQQRWVSHLYALVSSHHDNVNNIQGGTLDDPQPFSGAYQTVFLFVIVFLAYKTSTNEHHS